MQVPTYGVHKDAERLRQQVESRPFDNIRMRLKARVIVISAAEEVAKRIPVTVSGIDVPHVLYESKRQKQICDDGLWSNLATGPIRLRSV